MKKLLPNRKTDANSRTGRHRGLPLRTFILAFVLIPGLCFGYTMNSWNHWVHNLRQEAISNGISTQLFDHLFHNMTPNKRIIRFDRTQPEHRLTFIKYRNTRASKYRIKLGKTKYKRYHALLHKAGNHFGVSPCIITSIWGLETSYGHFVGNFDTIRSLATLAFDGRRSEFFRHQLLLALKMVENNHVQLKDFKGEWAGASGECQFLPSSWFKYAVDFNGDGHKDIWHTKADIFASIANYLFSNGWQANQPIMRRVILPHHFDPNLATLKREKTVTEWHHLGVRLAPGQARVNSHLVASIIEPYGGPALMVFNNFKTLMTWNYSSYYAGTVTYMAQQICKRG